MNLPTTMLALILPEPALAIDHALLAEIQPSQADQPAAWLPERLGPDRMPRPREPSERRVLVMIDGTRVEVPARMHLCDALELLALPRLLVPHGAPLGLVALGRLPEARATELLLVCDPRRFATE